MENETAKPKITARCNWKQTELIRNIKTFKPYFVVHVFIDAGTMVYDLESKEALLLPILIPPREYDNYSKDSDMNCRQKGDLLEFDYQPIII